MATVTHTIYSRYDPADREKLEKERKARFAKLEKVEAELRIAIEVFRTKKRCVLAFLFFFSVG